MSADNASMRFFYGTAIGRVLIKLLLKAGLPKLMAGYLQSSLSKRMIPGFIKKNNILMDDYPIQEYRSFAEFFSRKKLSVSFDSEPTHLISPCDGQLSSFSIESDSTFEIKGSRYRVEDLINDPELAKEYDGGLCLVFRLAPTDYHRYSFIDDGEVGENHYIEGALHCVQPVAVGAVPVYRLNRRCWTRIDTKNFGPVVQIEVGAMAVGGFVNPLENCAVRKGQEMGYFDLWGSTIVQFLRKDQAVLLPEIVAENEKGNEFPVKIGEQIGTVKE